MKRGFAAQFGERFTRRLLGWLKFLSPFEFIPRCPESRDFRFAPTSSGELKFKLSQNFNTGSRFSQAQLEALADVMYTI
jgi:hypothetical protein